MRQIIKYRMKYRYKIQLITGKIRDKDCWNCNLNLSLNVLYHTSLAVFIIHSLSACFHSVGRLM